MGKAEDGSQEGTASLPNQRSAAGLQVLEVLAGPGLLYVDGHLKLGCFTEGRPINESVIHKGAVP